MLFSSQTACCVTQWRVPVGARSRYSAACPSESGVEENRIDGRTVCWIVELGGDGDAPSFDWGDTDERVVGDKSDREVHHHQHRNRLRRLALGEDVEVG
jgi:hypothetical protein